MDEAVVDSQGVECCQTVLNGRNTCVTLTQYRSALGVYHVFCYSVDDGLTLQVDALYLVSRVLWCGIESHGKTQTGVQSFAK